MARPEPGVFGIVTRTRCTPISTAENRNQLWPVAALIEGDWSYTRRDGDLLELLFNLRNDAGELHNLANDPACDPRSNGCACSRPAHGRPVNARPVQSLMSGLTRRAGPQDVVDSVVLRAISSWYPLPRGIFAGT